MTTNRTNKTQAIASIIQAGIYKMPDDFKIKRPFNCSIGISQFKEAFLESVYRRSFFKDNKVQYIIDEDNKDVINQMYFYLEGSPFFKGNLFKGVLMLGNIGCGKTILMEAIMDILEQFSNKRITRVHAKDLHQAIIKNSIDFYRQRPMFIDDIGKEPALTKDFGNTIKPFEDLISYRYGEGGVLFGTSNYKLEDLNYPYHTIDRMKEMLNIIILPGQSRRR